LDIVTTLLLALGLAMDSFSVSVCGGLGLHGSRIRYALRTATVMGGFQALMPFLGWTAASQISGRVEQVDHWIAFGLLAFIGGRMIYEALAGAPDQTALDVTGWPLLLGLGVATSIDALAVGVSFAFLNTSILAPIVTIGVISFVLSLVGILVGCRAGEALGNRVPILGGIVLIGIGVQIVLEHTLPGFII